jgi:hypothetical protein
MFVRSGIFVKPQRFPQQEEWPSAQSLILSKKKVNARFHHLFR